MNHKLQIRSTTGDYNIYGIHIYFNVLNAIARYIAATVCQLKRLPAIVYHQSNCDNVADVVAAAYSYTDLYHIQRSLLPNLTPRSVDLVASDSAAAMGQMNCYKCMLLSMMITLLVLFNGFSQFLVFAQGHSQPDEPEPEFLSQLSNMTVAQGRDVSFTCVVNNLGQYRVAWIKSDSKAILGIHTHMVSLNPRLSVTHNGHNTWKLHISHVHLNDSGSYMCQVNTDPMKSQSGYLDVVVPPDILNHPDQNLEENVTNEGGIITLICSATGVPKPTVQWRRENLKDIVLRIESRERQVVKTVEGEKLVLGNVHRTDMGGYLCIASNGIPPSVSKRFDVHVNCK
uniref:Ig-like domain-containing protein n=2 Tax=Glossina TaxID=44049 RepID=A0A1A9Z437_GLOPL